MIELYIRKYSSNSYVGMGQVQTGVLYLRYRNDFIIMEAECSKAYTYKNLHYSTVSCASGFPLYFIKIEKSIR